MTFVQAPTSKMTKIEYRKYCMRQGFPWCDVCEEPAVWTEGFGFLHSTPAHPHGMPRHMDHSDHKVTARNWYNDRF